MKKLNSHNTKVLANTDQINRFSGSDTFHTSAETNRFDLSNLFNRQVEAQQ